MLFVINNPMGYGGRGMKLLCKTRKKTDKLILVYSVDIRRHVEVASSDDVGLVEVLDRFGRGLDVRVSFFLPYGKEVPTPNIPRVLRGETI